MATLGIYLIGARGNVATCTIVGALGLKAGLAPTTGLVTATSDFAGLPLADFGEMAFGGCDTTGEPLVEKARSLALEGRMLPPTLVESVAPELCEIDETLDTGTRFSAEGGTVEGTSATLSRITEQLETFRQRTGADRVVVVNTSTTEPTIKLDARHQTPEAFEATIREGRPGCATRAMLYAWAAFKCNMPYVNFTPSQGAEVPGIARLAEELRLPHAGKDGKTGETLIKTVLGPLFMARNLRVLSWIGNNYLGNDDGRALDDPQTRASKLAAKDKALRSLLGDESFLHTDIGYAPSLGDWKTAWDLIHFEGFLGTRMSMQFTWQGCDSALAAPLVLDLARLVEMAHRAEESGPLGYLSSFFKAPIGGTSHGFGDQIAALKEHVEGWR